MLPWEEQLDADVAEEYDEGDDADNRSVGDETGGAPTLDAFIPQSHFQPSPSFDIGGSSSSAPMSFDASFFQSFSTLQLEVSGLREALVACTETPSAYLGAWILLRSGALLSCLC